MLSAQTAHLHRSWNSYLTIPQLFFIWSWGLFDIYHRYTYISQTGAFSVSLRDKGDKSDSKDSYVDDK